MKMSKPHLLAALALVSSFAVAIPTFAADKKAVEPTKVMRTSNEGVAAVVNDVPITMSDVVERMKLIIVSSGIPNNPEIHARLKNQVINMLIEEALQMQQAKTMGIKITPEDVEGGFATVAKNNNTDVDKFKAMLAHDGISVNTLKQQMSAQIAWGKVVQRKIRPQIDVSDTDVDAREEFIKSSIGKTQFSIAEIFLPVDSPAQEEEVKTLAQKLLNEITQNHAPFQQVAFQFSQEAAASRGGDLGWVQEGQLPDAVNTAVEQMKDGDISQPIRSLLGYHIVLLRGKRALTAEDVPTRTVILEQIGNERLERQARRYLMDLKAGAFVDRRV